ncbi:MAG: hypothetical protein ACR2GX_05765 [Candidatus Dormibacteria bacterium]
MNLFTGLSTNQVISAILTFLLFGGYVTLQTLTLGAFYVTSRPHKGRVRTAAAWHLVAGGFTLLAIISTVWAAPAQKSFLDDETTSQLFPIDHFDLSWRFTKVEIGLVFAAIATLSMIIGVLAGRAQKRRWREEALAT